VGNPSIPPNNFPTPGSPQPQPDPFNNPPPVQPIPETIGTPNNFGGGLRVIVESNDPFVLQQVRLIEPGAFFQNYEGRRVIQVGIFSNEANARYQLDRLAQQGVSARIVNRSGGGQASLKRGYYAVVPGSRNELPRLRDRAIQSGVPAQYIFLRERPLGPHIAIGPYSDARNAQALTDYLNQRANLDARLFFSP
jgi:hypothetical protein